MILIRVGCAALAGRAGGNDFAMFQETLWVGFVLDLRDCEMEVVRNWKKEI